MVPARDLLQRRNPGFEVAKANRRLKQREVQVYIIISNGTDAPFRVVVPKCFVPVMEGFRCEESAWLHDSTVRRHPVAPKREVDAVEPVSTLGLLDI